MAETKIIAVVGATGAQGLSDPGHRRRLGGAGHRAGVNTRCAPSRRATSPLMELRSSRQTSTTRPACARPSTEARLVVVYSALTIRKLRNYSVAPRVVGQVNTLWHNRKTGATRNWPRSIRH